MFVPLPPFLDQDEGRLLPGKQILDPHSQPTLPPSSTPGSLEEALPCTCC